MVAVDRLAVDRPADAEAVHEYLAWLRQEAATYRVQLVECRAGVSRG